MQPTLHASSLPLTKKDCLQWGGTRHFTPELTVLPLSLHPPGGQLLASWLTAAPPSVCRPLTCWVDKHSRASGALAAHTAAACCRPACVAVPGESSQAEQTLPSCPLLCSAGTCRTLWTCPDWASQLKGLHPSHKLEYILPQIKNVLSSVFFFLCECVSYINYLVRWASHV